MDSGQWNCRGLPMSAEALEHLIVDHMTLVATTAYEYEAEAQTHVCTDNVDKKQRMCSAITTAIANKAAI